MRKALMMVSLWSAIGLGCASSYMKKTNQVHHPQEGLSVVTFFRYPIAIGFYEDISIWDNEESLGKFEPNSYFQHQAQPGEHLYILRSKIYPVRSYSLFTRYFRDFRNMACYIHTSGNERLAARTAVDWSYVKANIAYGKEYFLQCKTGRGCLKPKMELIPIRSSEYPLSKVKHWLSQLKPETMNQAKRTKYVAKRIESVRIAIDRYHDQQIVFQTLNHDDGYLTSESTDSYSQEQTEVYTVKSDTNGDLF